MTNTSKIDLFLKEDGPAALVIREWLMPVEGADGVVFPATFAAGDGFSGGYNIDRDPNGDICLIDSVGSQANRVEPLFMEEKYCQLVPQIVIRAGKRNVNLLEVGHRAGDALVRSSELQQSLRDAFELVLKGDAEPLAKTAPTSLVFGVWDSRDTQAKLPRLVASTLRAFDVRELTRGAVYLPPVAYVEEGLVDEALDTGKGKENPLSQKGFKHNPASGTHGGVIAAGGIRRDATLGLAALRLLRAGNNEEKTKILQRYILGLSLVAFTANTSSYLRQGCMLVENPDKAEENEFVEVYPTGERKPIKLPHKEALQFAKTAAKEFGIDPERKIEPSDKGPDRTVQFEKERAKKDIKGESGTVRKRNKAKSKKAESSQSGGA